MTQQTDRLNTALDGRYRIIGLLGVSEGLSGMAMGIHGRRVQCAVRLRHAAAASLWDRAHARFDRLW